MNTTATTNKFDILERATNPRTQPINGDIPDFGSSCTDYMFYAEYDNGDWVNVGIKPYGNLEVSPAMSAFHYGQAIFEGLKAYRRPSGEIVIFRPEKNWERFNKSASRMAMPTVPKELFIDAMLQLVKLEELWVPGAEGSSLYIRPFMVANENLLRMKPADKFLFMILLSPAASYYSHPLNILVTDHYTRAGQGGTGAAKAAGNYAAAMRGQLEAKEQGFDQMLWLEGPAYQKVQEIGTMNVFFGVGDKIITPSLDGNILEGVTRDSVIQLARSQGIVVEERTILIEEIALAFENGTLTDAFGTGTAASLAPIERIRYNGVDMNIPIDNHKFSTPLRYALDAIKYGTTPDSFGWLTKVE